MWLSSVTECESSMCKELGSIPSGGRNEGGREGKPMRSTPFLRSTNLVLLEDLDYNYMLLESGSWLVQRFPSFCVISQQIRHSNRDKMRDSHSLFLIF